MMASMDDDRLEQVREGVDALSRALSEERYRHVAGLVRRPELCAVFEAHGPAAHRETVVELREGGQKELAARVASLAAERAAASDEEAWRAADSEATGNGPDGPIGLADAELAGIHERDPERRRALGRAIAEAAGACSAPREAAAEARARVRASLGLTPPWDDVVEADDVLAASEGGYRDVLEWLARRDGVELPPRGDLDRTGLLHLLAFRDLDGLFRPAPLSQVVLEGFDGLGIDVRRVPARRRCTRREVARGARLRGTALAAEAGRRSRLARPPRRRRARRGRRHLAPVDARPRAPRHRRRAGRAPPPRAALPGAGGRCRSQEAGRT